MPAIKAVASELHRDATIGAVHVRIEATNEHDLPKPDEAAKASGTTLEDRGETTVRGTGIDADPSRQRRLHCFPS